MDGGTAVHRDEDQRGAQKQFTALIPSHHLQDQSKSFNSSCYSLTLLYDDFSFVFIEKNVIPDLDIKDFCSIFDDLNASPSSNFSASQEFHKFRHTTEFMEILKYFIDYFHYHHEFMYFMNLMGGYEERDEIYERESNN